MSVEAAGRPDTSSPLDGIPQPGETVGGKFVVERVLGVGGMGVVLAARHAQLGQQVAIKFLRKSAAESTEAVNRFLREARAAVALQSAHVVRVMDVGTLDGGLPYMIMEHLSGTDLGHVLEVRTALPVEEAVDYLLQALEAIAEAHSVGIVHRDLKPSNLFLTLRPDGSPLVKVLDFGISKAVDGNAEQVSLTATSMVLGSPLYMSPEQVRSTKNVDTRTDVWALGVILYELVAGAPPFEAESVTGLCAKIVADPPVPLRARRPDVPEALEAVVARCLEKEIARRPRSVAELASALKSFASIEGRLAVDRIARIAGAPRSAMNSVPESAPAAPAVSVSGSDIVTGYAETVATQQTMGTTRRRRVTTAALGVGAVAVAIVGLVARSSLRPPVSEGARPSGLAAEVLLPNAPTPAPAPASVPASASASSPASASALASASAALAGQPVEPPAATAAAIVERPQAGPSARPVWTPPPAPARPPPPRPAAASKPSAEDLLLDRK
jgi:eukaryotic-like serine/threonine-protein kinase